MKENIIIELFNKSFDKFPKIQKEAQPFLLSKLDELKIDVQDIALIETISDEELTEIVEMIRQKNADICSSINKSNNPNDELYKELIESFFIEINNTIDLVYNLIISKQLGG